MKFLKNVSKSIGATLGIVKAKEIEVVRGHVVPVYHSSNLVWVHCYAYNETGDVLFESTFDQRRNIPVTICIKLEE